MTCPRCGKPVPPPIPGTAMRRWCSDTCRVLAGRERRKAGLPPNAEMARRIMVRWDRVNAERAVQ